MGAYLNLAAFKSLTTMPGVHVDELEAAAPGWLLAQLDLVSADIDSRLRKRYVVPFDLTDPPLTVKRWLTRIVTREAYLKRGVDATDQQFTKVDEAAAKAEAELLEAANSETGLFDLPTLNDNASSGISKGAPFGYSEQSPYVWRDRQRDVAGGEDASGNGTSG